MVAAPKAITVYETSDRKQHGDEQTAIAWEQWLEDLAAANALFQAGGSLLDAIARAFSFQPRRRHYTAKPEESILAHVHKDTKLKISHWQCHDQPAYVVECIQSDGSIRAGGAGGWSGYYSSRATIEDVTRYAADTFARAKEVQP